MQRFAAVWNAAAIETHMQASEKLYRVKDRAFAAIRERLRAATPTTEYDIQQLMTGWFRDEGLVTDSPPIVAAAGNGGNPHYMPTASGHPAHSARRDGAARSLGQARSARRRVRRYHLGRLYRCESRRKSSSRSSRRSPPRATRPSRWCRRRRGGPGLQGWQVDRAASTVLRDAGFGAHILHRTGHSLGETVHGNGVNMDDYETHDDRRLLPGTGFTIEPGLYFDDFGVRTEINMLSAIAMRS